MPKIWLNKRITPEKVSKIQELVKGGSSIRSTAKKTDTSYSTVYRYAAQFSKRQTQIRLSSFNDREWGYIVGLFVGDGSKIANEKTGHYGLKFGLDANRDAAIVSFLRFLFEKSGKRVTCSSNGTVIIMKIYSKKLLSHLLEFVEFTLDAGKVVKTMKNRRLKKAFLLGFLGGLIDADGHLYVNKRKEGHFGASITTVNGQLLDQLKPMLTQLGINFKIHKFLPYKSSFSKKPTFYIRLSTFEFRKICSDLICIKHQQCGCVSKSLLES
jgi:hypothetical protein